MADWIAASSAAGAAGASGKALAGCVLIVEAGIRCRCHAGRNVQTARLPRYSAINRPLQDLPRLGLQLLGKGRVSALRAAGVTIMRSITPARRSLMMAKPTNAPPKMPRCISRQKRAKHRGRGRLVGVIAARKARNLTPARRRSTPHMAPPVKLLYLSSTGCRSGGTQRFSR